MVEIFEKYWKKPLERVDDIFEFINMTTDGGLFPRRGNDAAEARLLPAAVAVDVVQAGGVKFPVAGVDVTSTVTWTSRCGGGGEALFCGDPLCEQYGECSGGGRVCRSVARGSVPLHQGKIALLGAKGKGISSNNTAYACPRPSDGSDDDDYAVIGLGRGNTILDTIFSYVLDRDLQGSTVWVGNDALAAERDTAAQRPGDRGTTRLRLGTARRVYYVGIAGIKVAGGEVAGAEEAPADGIMTSTTTMPFTFLEPALFNHLRQELSAVASPVSASGSFARSFRQLCYPSGTELPAITLVFAAAGKDTTEMELRPEHYSYKKSSGVLCLSILRSPWASGGSVIGSMVQAGRRMTYNLKNNTLTFDVAASASSN